MSDTGGSSVSRACNSPHALLLLMIAIWGGSYAVVKDALAHLSPFAVIAVRFWIAVACLLPFLLGPHARGDLRRSAVPGAIAGAALAVGYLLQTVGMRETSASMGGFLAGLIPLLVAVGGFLFLRARLGRLGVVGLSLGFGGMGCLVWPTAQPFAVATDSLRGIALQVASSVSYAAHVLLLSHLGRSAPPLAFCMWQLVVTAVLATAALGFDPRLGAGDGAIAWSLRLVLDLAYLGVLATAVGIAVQARVQPRIPPMHVALLFATQPLFAALAGWWALGDAMDAQKLLGGALVVCGIVVTSLDRRAPSAG